MWWFCACIVAISTATLTGDEYGPFNNAHIFFYSDDRIAVLHEGISVPTSNPTDFVNWYLKANSDYTKLTGVWHPADSTWWYFNTYPDLSDSGGPTPHTVKYCRTKPCPSEVPVVCILNNYNNAKNVYHKYLSNGSPNLYYHCSTGEKWQMMPKLGVSNVVYLYNVYLKTYLGINKANPRSSQLQFYANQGIETEWTISGDDNAKCFKSNNNDLYLAVPVDDPYYGLYERCSTGEKWTIVPQQQGEIFAIFNFEYESLLGVVLAILLFINVIVMYLSCKKNKRNGYKNVKVVDSDEFDPEVVPINK